MATAPTDFEGADQLAEIRPFGELTPELRRNLAQAASQRQYPAERTLREHQQPVDDVLFVAEGQVKVVTPRLDGSRMILGFFGAQHPFGGLGLFDETYPGRIESLTPVRSVEIPNESLLELVRDSEGGIEPFIELATRRTRFLARRLHDSTVRPAERRLALVFQMFRESWGRHPEDGGEGILVPLSIRRRDLADLINTRTETAIRLVREWERSGLIRTEPEGFFIDAPEEIDALASPEE